MLNNNEVSFSSIKRSNKNIMRKNYDRGNSGLLEETKKNKWKNSILKISVSP